jgi:hypothetical protein
MKPSSVFRIGAVLLLLLAGGVAAVIHSPGTHRNKVAKSALARAGVRELPPALERHRERFKAIPGVGGEQAEGPGSAEIEKFLAKAYPDTDIPLANIEAARAAAARLRGKNFPTGRGRPGTWVTVGPSQALYPATDLRNVFGYVPASYVAGGRMTALAIDPNCRQGNCRLWVFAAGGGVWRTKNALDGQPNWEFLSAPFGMNSGSSITIDPNDPTGNTLYAGTGEANASADSAAGVGMFKSTDGGNTWTGPLGTSAFNGRAIGSIAVVPGQPNVVYAATTRGVAGVSSVSGGAVSLIPGAPPWGLYKSTDGGTSWTLVHDGASNAGQCDTVVKETAGGSPCSLRGVRKVALDPSDTNTVYAASFGRGVWRSSDAGATWVQIKPSLNSADSSMLPDIAVNPLATGATRMYVYEGSTGSPRARLSRTDDARAAAPVFLTLSSSNVALPGYGTDNLCTGQCWYDNFVYSPAGYADMVYVGGSYSYGQQFTNKRGVVLSQDAGVSATDMTMDATDPLHPNGMHPDQHALVTNPRNPLQFFETNDGGLMRSSGQLADASWQCAWRVSVGITMTAAQQSRCEQMLSAIPTQLQSMNQGLTSLQFQSVSVSPFNSNVVQGGTQDNGTWQTPGNPVKWENTMIGDGGQSGFDIANPVFRFHTFYDAQPDVNFSSGDMADWNWIGDPFFFGLGAGEPRSFYIPIITDPAVSKSMFAGLAHVWRTKTWGMGSMSLDDFRAQCNEWSGQFTVICGDWEALGTQTVAGRLTGTLYGADRGGGFVAAVERTGSDSSTLWAATSTGRVFISKNADANPASAVTFTRLDSLAANSPGRFVSGIYIDPANANHAWISYSGFNVNTSATPGHIFEVTYAAGTATWTDRSYDIGDIPINDIVRDDALGDLYASTDFGVFRLPNGASDWTAAAPGMPNVEVSGLTIVPSARKLYAATHGLSVWILNLP